MTASPDDRAADSPAPGDGLLERAHATASGPHPAEAVALYRELLAAEPAHVEALLRLAGLLVPPRRARAGARAPLRGAPPRTRSDRAPGAAGRDLRSPPAVRGRGGGPPARPPAAPVARAGAPRARPAALAKGPRRRRDLALSPGARVPAGQRAAYAHLGDALNQAGDLAGARMALERAVELDPRDAKAHHLLGRVFDRLGYPDEARAMYRAFSGARRRVILVVVGDLAREPVDAVLRPADATLAPVGAAAVRLDEAGGERFAAQRRTTTPLEAGAAVVTGGRRPGGAVRAARRHRGRARGRRPGSRFAARWCPPGSGRATGGCRASRPRWWAPRAGSSRWRRRPRFWWRRFRGAGAGGSRRAPHRGRARRTGTWSKPSCGGRRDPVAELTKRYGKFTAVDGDQSRGAPGRAVRLPRPQRRRQDHHDADDRRHPPADERHGARSAASTSRRGRSRPRRGSASSPTGRSSTTSSPAASSCASSPRSTASRGRRSSAGSTSCSTLFELAPWKDELTETYSHGMRQKLIICGRAGAPPRGDRGGRADGRARPQERPAAQGPVPRSS